MQMNRIHNKKMQMTVDDLIDEINIEELYNKVVTCGCCCSSHGGGKARYE